jgi:hypothetical protein
VLEGRPLAAVPAHGGWVGGIWRAAFGFGAAQRKRRSVVSATRGGQEGSAPRPSRWVCLPSSKAAMRSRLVFANLRQPHQFFSIYLSTVNLTVLFDVIETSHQATQSRTGTLGTIHTDKRTQPTRSVLISAPKILPIEPPCRRQCQGYIDNLRAPKAKGHGVMSRPSSRSATRA